MIIVAGVSAAVVGLAAWVLLRGRDRSVRHAPRAVAAPRRSAPPLRQVQLPGPPCRAVLRSFRQAVCEMRRLRERHLTEFVADVEAGIGALRIATPPWSALLPSFYGGREIEVGDAAFDMRYSAVGTSKPAARAFLDAATRARVRELDKFSDGACLIEVRPGQMRVRIGRRLFDIDQDRFVAICCALVERLMAAAAGGAGGCRPATLGEGRCPVCGDSIEARHRVVCETCGTAHHAECWGYGLGCSTFACSQEVGAAA